MNKMPSRQRQGGAILFALLAFSLLSTVVYLSVAGRSRPSTAQTAEAALQNTLSQAREALIARAAADDNRPGSLPCPDLLTDTPSMANYPGDGKADMLTRNRCPSDIGWLPWVTLNIPQPIDDRQSTLWYVIAPALYDDDSAMPINSNKPSRLALQGNDEIAALIIAARAPLTGQLRPSNNPVDYLEGQLQSDFKLEYLHGTSTSNDKILAISRSELIAAVEQSIAHRIRHCLSAHARQVGHYPWPAPLSVEQYQGKQGTLFGHLPLTQPNDSIAQTLEKALIDLATQTAGLANAADGPAKLAALAQLAEFSTRAKNLFSSLNEVSTELKVLGNKASSLLKKLDDTIRKAAEGERISVTEGKNILSQQAAALVAVNALDDALFRYGLDALPWLAPQQNITDGAAEQNARSLLLKKLDQWQTAGDIFASQHNAEPRPLQALLVAPAIAIGTITTEIFELNQTIVAHADAVLTLAKNNLALAETSLLMITGSKKARDATASWLDKPTAANRNKMDLALAELAEASQNLSTGLQNQVVTTSSNNAAAWPMIWASAQCEFLKNATGWWHDNAWSDLVFYQISAPEQLTDGHLHIDGKTNLPLLVLTAGPPLPGQIRPNKTVEHYLEGRNNEASRNGDANNPSIFFDRPTRGNQINDRIAY